MEVSALATVAVTQPHAAYYVITYGMVSHWIYIYNNNYISLSTIVLNSRDW